MAGRGKVLLFDLGLLVCLWVEVSSRPEEIPIPSPVMSADKPDFDTSRAIETFDDTHLLADTRHFDTSRAIYTSADAPVDVNLDSFRTVDPSTVREMPEDTHNPDSPIATDPSSETPADKLIPDSSFAMHSSTDTDLPHPDSSTAMHTFAEDISAHVGPPTGSVMGQNDIRKALIEDFKKRVLDGLKLANAPTETLNGTEFSNDLIEVLQQENEVTRSDQKENIVVHSSNSKQTHSI